jgi:hypothetical protein
MGMNRTIFLALAGVALLAPASHAGSAYDQLDNAMTAVRDEGGKCSANLSPSLVDVRQLLSDGDVAGAAKIVKRMQRGADAWCGRDVLHRLRQLRNALEATDDTADSPPPVKMMTIDSRVDGSCVSAIKAKYPFGVDQAAITSFLSTCRTGTPDPSMCSSSAAEANPTCEQQATSIYTYVVNDDVRAAIATGCQTFHCTLPQTGRTVRTAVDASCVARQKAGYAYAADADTVDGWVVNCRNQLPAGTCKVVDVGFDGRCFETALRAYTFALTQDVANRLLTDCKTTTNQCE